MIFKHVVVLLVVIVAGVCANNYTFGQRGPYDRLLDHQEAKAHWKLLSKVTLDATYPNKASPQPRGTISQIVITDLMEKGHAGVAYLASGGVGQNYATIHMKSKRNRGIHYRIDIYGH